MVKKKKKMTHGGFRKDSGRKPFLIDAVKKLFRLEPRHIQVLQNYATKESLDGGCNAALRDILDKHEF